MARIDSIRSQVPQPAGSFQDTLATRMAAPAAVSRTQAVARVPITPLSSSREIASAA